MRDGNSSREVNAKPVACFSLWISQYVIYKHSFHLLPGKVSIRRLDFGRERLKLECLLCPFGTIMRHWKMHLHLPAIIGYIFTTYMLGHTI